MRAMTVAKLSIACAECSTNTIYIAPGSGKIEDAVNEANVKKDSVVPDDTTSFFLPSIR